MPTLNKVMLMGHLGKDPEIRYMPNGDAVCNFSIATSRKWKGQDGETKEDTQWHNISCFGKRAELVGEYLHKGSPLYVEGWLRTRKWQDKEGNDRYTTEVVMDNMQFLGGKQDKQEKPARPPAVSPPSDLDDDVPF